MGLTFPPLPPFSPSAPWYLEKIEVVLLSTTAPLCWEAHYRGWVGGQGEAAEQRGGGAVATTAAVTGPPTLDPALVQQPQASAAACVEMVPDPVAWEEWDMQVIGEVQFPLHTFHPLLSGMVQQHPIHSGRGGYLRFPPMRMGEDALPSITRPPSPFQIGRSGKLVTACFNRNLREWRWHAPALTPLPSRPGAVPCLVPRNPFSAVGPQEWLYGTPLGCARSNVRFLDELAELPAPSSRIRQHYGIGRGGQLGLQGLQV